MTKVLVCGDRNWNNVSIIRDELSKLTGDIIIIHGNARGADTIAGFIADEIGLEVIVVKVEWDKYGKRAGSIRNTKMLKEHSPKLVLVFHNDINNSKGTKDAVNKALKLKIYVKVVSDKNVLNNYL